MDFDQLQQQWAAFDKKLDDSIKLNQRVLREATISKTRRALSWHKAFIGAEMAVGVLFTFMLGSFSANHWGEWEFVIPAVLLHLWTIGCIAFVVVQMAALARIDYTQPIATIHAGLLERCRARIRFVKWAMASGTILWVLWAVVGLKGIWNINMYAGGSHFVWVSLVGSAVLVAAVSAVCWLMAERWPFLRRMESGMIGYSLQAALGQLEELESPEAPLPATPRAKTHPAKLSHFVIAVLLALLLIVGFVACLSLGLVALPAPTFGGPPTVQAMPPVGPCIASSTVACVRVRDGSTLAMTRIPGTAPLSIVLVHGLMADSRSMAATAQALHDATGAEVWMPDLRGHGRSQGRFGDIDYTNQYERDLADLMDHVRAQRPANKLVLAGHAMGGGLVVRYMRAQPPTRADAYLLYAPTLGNDAPTERRSNANVAIHGSRAIGLLMLSGIGIHAFDGLPTLYFNVPPGQQGSYSFRAMRNIGSVNYGKALAADDKPMLVLVGANDSYHKAEQFQAVFGLHRNTQVMVAPDAGYQDILTNGQARDAAARWLATLNP